MHMPKYALCCAGGCIPCLCSKFAAQDLSHVQLWRTAIEYRPASNSSQCGMPIFGCCIFLHGKKKQNPPDSTVEQSQPAVKC